MNMRGTNSDTGMFANRGMAGRTRRESRSRGGEEGKTRRERPLAFPVNEVIFECIPKWVLITVCRGVVLFFSLEEFEAHVKMEALENLC